VDGDGFTPDAGDCHDANDAINPDAAEEVNGLDDNCDGALLGGQVASNGGVGECLRMGVLIETAEGDYEFSGPPFPSPRLEIPDGLDNNCDGVVDNYL
jgi:hypothetical protein